MSGGRVLLLARLDRPLLAMTNAQATAAWAAIRRAGILLACGNGRGGILGVVGKFLHHLDRSNFGLLDLDRRRLHAHGIARRQIARRQRILAAAFAAMVTPSIAAPWLEVAAFITIARTIISLTVVALAILATGTVVTGTVVTARAVIPLAVIALPILAAWTVVPLAIIALVAFLARPVFARPLVALPLGVIALALATGRLEAVDITVAGALPVAVETVLAALAAVTVAITLEAFARPEGARQAIVMLGVLQQVLCSDAVAAG